MGEKNKNILLLMSGACDLLINLVCVYCFFLIFKGDLQASGFSRTEIVFTIGLCFFSILMNFMMNLYSHKRFEKLHKALMRLSIASFMTLIVSFLLIAIFASSSWMFYVYALICAGASWFLLSLKKTITTKLTHVFRAKRRNDRKILIVGNGLGAVEYKKEISRNLHFGYNIIGCVCDGETEHFDKLGEIEELQKVIEENNPYEVVIAPDTDEVGIQDIINVCERCGIRTSIIPLTYKYFKSQCQVDMIGDLPIINTRAIPLDNIANAFIKRVMDIVISLIMIIITSPIMLVAAIGVRLSSKGPVVFKQKRVGKNNQLFTMYKFRSMKVNEDSDTAWTTDDDPRKTKFGTFMRKTGIDELPQLFNVLFGSMSIIGPRPELPTFVEQYSKTIPLYRIKHQVKPGMTGLAQIYGFRGDTSIEKRIEFDIRYIENWSVFNDIRILVITPLKMFNRNEKYVR